MPQVQCPDCGHLVNESGYKAHRKRFFCVARQRQNEMRARGFSVVGSWQAQICSNAGVSCEVHYSKAVRGHRHKLLPQHWVPMWAREVLNTPSLHMDDALRILTDHVEGRIGLDEVRTLCTILAPSL